MRPVIGITTYHMPATGVSLEDSALLPWRYVSAVRNGGGVPVLLPPGDVLSVEDVLESVDGLLIPGGTDISPDRYDALRHPETDKPYPDRDAWEIALTREAISQEIPLLGICRGMQVINVACGGTLHQHLPDLPGTDGSHASGWHEVRVSAFSLLGGILSVRDSSDFLNVPTHHHQAVNDLGADLAAAAWSRDGTVEAIESASGLVLGVQWHPERSDDHRLLSALTTAVISGSVHS